MFQCQHIDLSNNAIADNKNHVNIPNSIVHSLLGKLPMMSASKFYMTLKSRLDVPYSETGPC